jgi:hypothetical protein
VTFVTQLAWDIGPPVGQLVYSPTGTLKGMTLEWQQPAAKAVPIECG